ncbi:DUF3397 family protein [Leuconostoc sp. JNUCC 76]
MQWWIWPLGGFIFWTVVIIFKEWTALKQASIKTLDIITIPNWIVLHQTMGYLFGISFVAWFLLIWLVVGMFLAWFLLQNNWRWQTFWRRYWQWSGLLAAIMVILITIIGLFLH